MTTTRKFEVGRTYSSRFFSDWDSIAHFIVLSRTAKSVKVVVHRKLVTRRIKEYRGCEQFKPFGSYANAMVINADDPDLTGQSVNAPVGR